MTKREVEVIRLVARGLSNAETGERQFIARRNVRTHTRNVLVKPHLVNRIQLAPCALREGIDSLDREA